MQTHRCLALACSLAVLGLFFASCAPAAAPTPTAKEPAVAPKPPVTPAALTPSPKPAAEQPRYGGTLTLAIKTVTRHFDMHQETSGSLQLPLAPSYNLLLQHNPSEDFKITSDLAKSWDIDASGLLYAFRLHDGVRFHNGRPLTAEDVRYNLERIINPPKGILSPRQELYRNVRRIEASDATTLKIALKEPQASFLSLAALPYNFIFDPEVIKKKGDMTKEVMGTGPFKMVDFVYTISYKARRNEDYFVKGRPYLDGFTVYVVTDELTRSAAMRTKRVQILPLYGAVSNSLSQQMQKTDPAIVLQKRVTPGPQDLVANLKISPWSDIRVRRAVSLAIDREAASKAVRDFYPGYGYVVPGSVWELPKDELKAMPGYRQPKDGDIAEARRLLAEAGYPDGFESPLLATTTIYHIELAQVAQAQLAKVGVNLKIFTLESGAWKKRIYDGAFDLGVSADASAVDDPDILLGEYYLSGSPKNYGGWNNPKFDELYTLQSKTMDATKRKEIVWEMQRLLHQEAPRIGALWATFYAASWPEVRDWTQGSSLYLGNSLQDVWLAK